MTTTKKSGFYLIQNSATNKSTAFTAEERDELGIRGLLPYAKSTIDIQMKRALKNFREKSSDVDRYVFLRNLQDRSERLYYHLIIENIEEMLPIIYTPTVGIACKRFAHIFRKPRGFYINPEDNGHIRRMLDNWPTDDVKIIVVTDGQRILGLGDLGSNGMGIPIGKLSLYVACAGIRPEQCMPIMLDVGTNNEEYLNDPLYLGYPHHRIKGQQYLDLVEEFIVAVKDKFPEALIQFEDFLTPNAYSLLERYRDRILCFNDDIQGTAAVALAGVYASTRISNIAFKDLRVMFLGAGSAATGIGDLMVDAFMEEGLTYDDAVNRLYFVDKQGLIVKKRTDLFPHNLPYAHDVEQVQFVEAINTYKPHVLIGATGFPDTFTKDAIEAMSAINEHPTIFALSNPTSRAECTAEEAYRWSNGKAIFASGSPFAPVIHNKISKRPGQGNNAYIFPGVGLGAIAVRAKSINSAMFLASARSLARQVNEDDLDTGTLYPPMTRIREVSLTIAVAVAEAAYDSGLAQLERPDNLRDCIKSLMYEPRY